MSVRPQEVAPPPRTAAPSAAPSPRPVSFTARAVVLAFLLVPLNAWWLIQVEYARYADNGTTAALFFNAIALALILLMVNAVLARVRPRWRFAPGELVIVYIVISVATSLAGHDQLQILFATITYLPRNAGPGTPWQNSLLPNVAEHLLAPRGPALDDLFKGESTLYRADHLLPWITPLGWWTGFALILTWTMLCMTALLRRQWDAERLAYPIAEVPIQVMLNADTLFHRPMLWIGVALGAVGQLVNLCHAIWPTVPTVPIGVQYFQFPDAPLRHAGAIPICLFPFALGLCFFLPLQIGFSCWFFFFLARVETIISTMNGWSEPNKFPYISQQGVGALIGFALMVLWGARTHLRHVVRAAFGLVRGQDEDEPMSYRLAFFGFLGGFALLIGFAIRGGMQPATALYYFTLLLTFVLVMARMRAEVGLPTFEFYRVGAEDILTRVGGTAAWTKSDQGMMAFFYFLTRTHRQFPITAQVDSFRLARRGGLPLSRVTLLIMGASALGILCAFWAMLHISYETGFESAKFRGPVLWAFGPEPWRRMESLLNNPTQPEEGSLWAYAFGFVVVLSLGMLRSRFLEWPFHPAGYLASGSFGLFRLWLPLFTAWALKALILRYGGLRGYRMALPLFIGLVLGEFSAGFMRTLLDLIFGLHLPPNSGIGGL